MAFWCDLITNTEKRISHWISDQSVESSHADSSVSSYATKKNDGNSHSSNERNETTDEKLKNTEGSRRDLVNSPLQSQTDPSTNVIFNGSSSVRSGLNQSLLRDPSSNPEFNSTDGQDSSARVRLGSDEPLDKLSTRLPGQYLSENHRRPRNSSASGENTHRLYNSNLSSEGSTHTRHTIGCTDLTHEKGTRPVDASNIQVATLPCDRSTKARTGKQFHFNHKLSVRN